MKKLEDGTIRIEFEDEKRGIYHYKNITKKMISDIKNNEKAISIFDSDNKPNWKEIRSGYVEDALYHEETLPGLIVTKNIIKNGRVTEKLTSVVVL